VAGELHGRATGNAGALEVADRRAAEIMDKPSRYTGILARIRPCAAEVFDSPAVRVNEYSGKDARVFAFDRLHNFPLPLKYAE
jgi:hypothetical protein